MPRSGWSDRFARIGEIDVQDPQTWESRLFLTIDLDWAIDPAIELCLDMLDDAGVAATLFVTHDTPLLARIRSNRRLELGVHPNFNRLLDGEAGSGSAEAVMHELQRLVPEARAVRSHSMTQSSRLLDLFVRCGMTHDCNHFVPVQSGITLKPYAHWKRALTRVPYCWEDDIDLEYGAGPSPLDIATAGTGLRVFDFHPIHLALNTVSIEHYETTRSAHRTGEALREAAAPGPGGVRDRFAALLQGRMSS